MITTINYLISFLALYLVYLIFKKSKISSDFILIRNYNLCFLRLFKDDKINDEIKFLRLKKLSLKCLKYNLVIFLKLITMLVPFIILIFVDIISNYEFINFLNSKDFFLSTFIFFIFIVVKKNIKITTD